MTVPDGPDRMAGLEVFRIKTESSRESPPPTMVILHGYGADFRDLAPLAKVLGVPKGASWLFPNASLEVPIGPHMTGRAWFPIDVMALERAMMSGTHRDFSKEDPSGFLEARDGLERLLDELVEKGEAPGGVILGGFSQGAMLATDLALTWRGDVRALLALSATLVAEDRLRGAATKKSGLPVFQSHGFQDPLLAFQAAESLHALFEEAGLKTQWHPFEGGHEIPPGVMGELQRFLEKF